MAWWGTAWLRGHLAPDDLVDALLSTGPRLRVAGLLAGEEESVSLIEALAALRRQGATFVGAALPVEGDPVGLGGPGPFNQRALEAAEAVVVAEAGVGLIPPVGTSETLHEPWHSQPAHRRQLGDVGQADRDLRAALREGAEALADLEVAKWRPEVADRLMNLRHPLPLYAPPGVPPRCVELAARGRQAVEICALALEDDGAALTALEASARRSALVPLDRAGRRALTAACSPEVWPG